MTPQQAIELLTNATATFKGTRQDHVKIQEALSLLTKEISKPRPKK